MNRQSFLKRLLATLFGAAIANPSLRAQTSVIPSAAEESDHTEPVEVRYLLSATVAGTYYYDFPQVGEQLFGPDASEFDRSFQHMEHPAQLVLDTHNPFDFRAIEVWWNDHKMGYIPRKDNKVLYNLLKDGHQLQAFIRLQYLHDPDMLVHVSGIEGLYELRIRVYLPSGGNSLLSDELSGLSSEPSDL
jgi:hypothetical protein